MKTGQRRPIAGIAAVIFAILATGWPGTAPATEPVVLRIGTGGVGGTYYPIGSLIAAGISEGASEVDCAGTAPCGAHGVLAVAQASNGSVANIAGLRTRAIELALAQSNVVDWAYNAQARFKDASPAHELRVIATLYAETLHLVVRANAGIASGADLRGRRISLDEPGSGTLDDAREVLRSFGLAESDLAAEYVKPDLAIARMLEGRLDGFFIVAGAPVASLLGAAPRLSFTLLPVDGARADGLLSRLPFYSRTSIPAGVYPGVPETRTIAVGAQLIVRSDAEDALVYEVTRALWSPRTRKLLDNGHAKGRDIRPENALAGISIPMHPGAERYYREAGMLRR